MNTIKRGSRGKDVLELQRYLHKYWSLVPDGSFGQNTENAVMAAQKALGLKADGVVGPITREAFVKDGADGLAGTVYSDGRPTDYRPLSQAEKVALFGLALDGDGNAPSGFSKNLVTLQLGHWFPDIDGVKSVQVHRLVERQWRAFFQDVVDAGLASRVISCAGGYVPRMVRGSKTTMSSHAFGTAIDFNAQWNWLGNEPAGVGERGSLKELYPHMKKYRLWSGAWFSRLDGMHLESTTTDDELGLSLEP